MSDHKNKAYPKIVTIKVDDLDSVCDIFLLYMLIIKFLNTKDVLSSLTNNVCFLLLKVIG